MIHHFMVAVSFGDGTHRVQDDLPPMQPLGEDNQAKARRKGLFVLQLSELVI